MGQSPVLGLKNQLNYNMKKLIFSFLIFVIAGFAAQTLSVSAASPQAAAVLGAEETKVLIQTLTVLKIMLEDMRGLIASVPSPAPNNVELNVGLEAIKGKLVLMNATIESQALAYAKRVGGTEDVALSPPAPTPPVATKESAPLVREEVSPNEQTAALTASVGQRNILLWVALGFLVIAGVLLFVEWRKKREPKLAAAVVEEPQKPIMPMVREDNIQGIPPDY